MPGVPHEFYLYSPTRPASMESLSFIHAGNTGEW